MSKAPIRYITYKGETKRLAEWAQIAGLSRSRLYTRLFRLHWPVEKAMTTPSKLP